MTTNNHPAHGPVSLERLHQIREHLQHDTQYSKGGNRAYILADVLKVIDGAISAFGAEPVLYAAEETLAYARMGELHLKCLSQPMGDAVIPLYTSPPAPVVPKEMYWKDAPIEGSTRAAAYATGWNTCRAAMLKAGNSPVTPEGWIPVSERMPEAHEPIYIFHPDYGVDEGVWYDNQEGAFLWDSDYSRCRAIETVSHWMPMPALPAAPQQEVKSALEHGMQRYAGAMQKLSEGDK